MTDTPYPFDTKFEAALVTMCCGSRRLWLALGKEIVPDLLNTEPAKLAIKAAREVAFIGGNSPTSTIIVCQMLRQWQYKGTISHEDVMEVLDLFDRAEDAGLPKEEELIEGAKPILRERILKEATRTAIVQQGKQGDFSEVAKMIDKAENLGIVINDSIGTLFGDGAFDEINKIRNLTRANTGIIELDAELWGGPEQGSLTVFVGGAGDGKSMMLVQIACENLLNKFNVAYVTLELNKSWTFARMAANVTGIPIVNILNGSLDKAQKLLRGLLPKMGKLRLEYFTPGATTIEEIKQWVKRIEEEDGIRYDVVIIDYGDKLSVPSKRKTTSYYDMLEIFEKFRVWVEEEQRWGYTASQAKRKDKKQKRITINDVADSQHKVRVADIIITLNVEGDELYLCIVKNRNGTLSNVGPLAMDLECARIAGIYRPYENQASNSQTDMFT